MHNTTKSLHDLVRHVTTDERFFQLQKLEAVGRLAGGVAHDFNNLLTVILGYCQMLQYKHGDNKETCALLQEIYRAGERASWLTRQLLLFSRKERMQPVVLHVNDVVSGLVKMLQRLIGDNIELTTDLDPQLGHVRADLGQIEQVIMNLAINARDAMPQGGKLRIETRSLVLSGPPSGENTGIAPGAWVTLVVRDTGCGMSEEVLAHLYEPFFTTKGTGKGTGLGLATAYGIIVQSGGHIRVLSRPGVGTRFRVFLPQVTATVQKPKPGDCPKPLPTGQGTILLVEDDAALRTLAAMALQSVGYSILQAAHGGEALSVANKSSHPINLMITDVIMPIMSGPQLAAKLLTTHPQLKVLYMSGYTDSLLALHQPDIQGVFLQKPFTPDALVDAVQSVMASRPC